jgi:hypothetical protein
MLRRRLITAARILLLTVTMGMARIRAASANGVTIVDGLADLVPRHGDVRDPPLAAAIGRDRAYTVDGATAPRRHGADELVQIFGITRD